MFMGSTVLAPSQAEILEHARKLTAPDAVKKLLAQTSDQIAVLDQQRLQVIDMQRQAAEERKAVDAAKAAANADLRKRSDALAAAESRLAARATEIDRVLTAFAEKLTALEEQV